MTDIPTLPHLLSLIPQSLPQLSKTLDTFLSRPSLLDPLLPSLLPPLLSPPQYEVLYTLFKIRGAKTLVKYLPHSVIDLQHLIQTLVVLKQPSWQARLYYFYHLSVALQAPFPLETVLDENDVNNVVKLAVQSLNGGREAKAAAIFLGRLCVREDCQRWREIVVEEGVKRIECGGGMLLATLFKIVRRMDMRIYVNRVYKCVMERLCELEGTERHMGIKLLGRLVLAVIGKEGIEDMEMVEDCVGVLLEGLGNEAHVVRWSSAKYLGRIAGKLGEEMGEEVVEGVIEVLERRYEYGERWRREGGCLTIGELGRRGSLGKKFKRVVESVIKNCRYEGGSVKDAACYALWSLGRVGKVEGVLEKVVGVAVLDGEVRVRRAMAAAIQECVGRGWGMKGIESVVEFGRVGSREVCYLEIVGEIRKWTDLGEEVLEKVADRDMMLRRLAGKCLAKFWGDEWGEEVLRMVERGGFCERHGGILALAEIMKGGGVVKGVENVPGWVGFEGGRGEEMRNAVCKLILELGKCGVEGDLDVWWRICEGGFGGGDVEGAAEAFARVVKGVRGGERGREWVVKGVRGEFKKGYMLVAAFLGMEEILKEGVKEGVEVRVYAMRGLGWLGKEEVLSGLGDYERDERGDVGSWVREECMLGCVKWIEGGGDVMKVLGGVLEQGFGRIDRTRIVAGRVLKQICEGRGGVCGELWEILKGVRFEDSEAVLGMLGEVLRVGDVGLGALKGILWTGGGGGLIKVAQGVILEWWRGVEREKWMRVLMEFMEDERLRESVVVVLGGLGKGGGLNGVDEGVLKEVVRVVRQSWRGRMKQVRYMIQCIGLLGEFGMLAIRDGSFVYDKTSLGRDCLEALGVVLGGGVPRLRRVAMECMYLMLVEFWEDGKRGGEAIDVLLASEWEKMDVVMARERRNLVCSLLGVDPPVLVRGNR